MPDPTTLASVGSDLLGGASAPPLPVAVPATALPAFPLVAPLHHPERPWRPGERSSACCVLPPLENTHA